MRAIGILGALAPLCLTASCTLIVGNVDFDGTNSTTSTGGTGGTTGSGGTSSSTSNTTGSGGHAGGTVCEPFTQKACYDADPSTLQGACHAGKQTCAKDGSGYGACTGQVTPAAEDDCVNKADTSCDGKLSCACTPKATEPCYDGTPGTEQHLPCKGGTRTCADDGSGWGGCAGQVTPKPVDDCTTQDDENCDGVVNDFCVCQTGQTQGCYTGKVGTEGVGLCHGGTQGCNSDGTGWAACNGEVKPQAEVCSAVGDEDCDGIACSEVVWADGFVCQDPDSDMLHGLAVDGQGNSFLNVSHGAGIDFGNGVTSGAGTRTLAKIGPDGKALWKVDGPFWGAPILAPGVGYALVPVVTAAGTGVDAYYMTTGAHMWSQLWPGAPTVTAMAPCGSGVVVIAGSYSGTPTLGTVALPTASGKDGFIASIRSDTGAPVWALRITDATGQGAVDQGVGSVACDAGGRIFVTGNFKTSVAIGTSSYVNTGNNDFYVASIDPSTKAALWLKPFGTAAGTSVTGIAIDSGGAPLIVGATYSSADFGGGLMTNHGGLDSFLLKLDATGAYKWSKLLGAGDSERFMSVAVDAQNEIVIAGEASGPAPNVGGPALTAGAFLAKYDASGNHLWSKGFATAGSDSSYPVAAVRPGGRDIFFGAANPYPLDLGTGPLGSGTSDLVVLGRFQP